MSNCRRRNNDKRRIKLYIYSQITRPDIRIYDPVTDPLRIILYIVSYFISPPTCKTWQSIKMPLSLFGVESCSWLIAYGSLAHGYAWLMRSSHINTSFKLTFFSSITQQSLHVKLLTSILKAEERFSPKTTNLDRFHLKEASLPRVAFNN